MDFCVRTSRAYFGTTAVLIMGCVFFLITSIFNLDVFETLHAWFHVILLELETFEGDEFLVVIGVAILAFFVDLIRLRRKSQAERYYAEKRLREMQDLLADVQDVVNNFLNNLQLFRLEAENTQALDESYLKLYDDLIAETAQKILALEESLGEAKIKPSSFSPH